jgi:hypothetical protein
VSVTPAEVAFRKTGSVRACKDTKTGSKQQRVLRIPSFPMKSDFSHVHTKEATPTKTARSLRPMVASSIEHGEAGYYQAFGPTCSSPHSTTP